MTLVIDLFLMCEDGKSYLNADQTRLYCIA